MLLAVATAVGAHESWANDIQAIIRGADQAFNRAFAEGFIRTWPREMAARDLPRGADGEPSRPGQDDGLVRARHPEQPRAGSEFATPLDGSAAAGPPKPSNQMPPAEILAKRSPDVSPAEPAPPAPKQRVAKADPVAPPLPEASATSPAGFKFKDCDFCPPLVVVPNGAFQMGSSEHPNEKPAHKVRIPLPFAIGQYEVTYAQWDRCVEAGACRYRPEHQDLPNDAIGNLSWDDANAYLKWMSEKTGQIYRLPSEAEWEFAARAGSSGKANCSDCGEGTNGQPSAAGTYKPNPFGLYDTAGNMAEWVQDCWNEILSGRACRRVGLGERQLRDARIARRVFRQQVDLYPVLGALSLRQRCPLRSKRLPRPQGVALMVRFRNLQSTLDKANAEHELLAGGPNVKIRSSSRLLKKHEILASSFDGLRMRLRRAQDEASTGSG